MSSLLKKLNPFRYIKNFLPRSLFARSLLIIVVPMIIFQILVTTVFVDNHWRKVSSRLAFSLVGEIGVMTRELEQGYSVKRVLEMARYGRNYLDLIVTVEPNRTLTPYIETSGAWEPFIIEALSDELDSQIRRPFSLSLGPDDKWVNIGIQMEWGVFRVFALERRLFSSSAYICLLWMVGSSIILFTIAVVFMRNQIRPIHKLAAVAERLGKGRDIGNFKPEGSREVRAAGRAFINMQERIKRQIEQRTTMLAGISHDLKTPLTRMKLALAMFPDNQDAHALKGDVADMERMIASYLDFVRGAGEEASASLSLRDLLSKLSSQVSRHDKIAHIDMVHDIDVTVRPLAFERALQNFISNAERYGNEIWLTAYRNEDDVLIIVEDNGVGIDPKNYDDVFKPFFRVDSSRNSATGGVGLGMTIARDIILAHGGQVTLAKSAHGGLKVTITVPV